MWCCVCGESDEGLIRLGIWGEGVMRGIDRPQGSRCNFISFFSLLVLGRFAGPFLLFVCARVLFGFHVLVYFL